MHKSKKAISSIIVTILLIGIVLSTIGIAWFMISNILNEEAERIGDAQDSIYSRIDMDIIKAQASIESDVLTVKVRRNAGGEDLIGINFIVSNEISSGAVKEYIDLKEMEEQTFIFNLAAFGFDTESAEEVSIAPIVQFGSGESIKDILDTKIIDKSSFYEEPPACSQDSDCGTDSWVSGTEYCNNSEVWQTWIDYSCEESSCEESSSNKLKESCSAQEKICSNGACIEEPPECSQDSDCGTDKWISGTEYCNDNEVWQMWIDYACENNECNENSSNKLKENCTAQGENCSNGECYMPLECVENSDCGIGYMCVENECVPEYVINSGLVFSIWPLSGGAEYFDSADLPKSEADYKDYFVRFPNSTESRCLKITEYVLPESPTYRSYIRLNSTSSINANDNYEIWETLWGCSN
jgi:hypothetical protein